MTCGEVSLISWSCFVLPAIFAVSLLAGTPAKPAGGVVLITIDTLRADHLGCYGYRNGATPTIDALAVRAAKFEHAYAVAAKGHPHPRRGFFAFGLRHRSGAGIACLVEAIRSGPRFR